MLYYCLRCLTYLKKNEKRKKALAEQHEECNWTSEGEGEDES